MENEIIKSEIENRIFQFRGVSVMIDQDLAELYQVAVKRLNEQVKRNIARFPENFRFQLNAQEVEQLVANCDWFKKERLKDFPLVAKFATTASDKNKWFAFSKMNAESMAILEQLKNREVLGYGE